MTFNEKLYYGTTASTLIVFAKLSTEIPAACVAVKSVNSWMSNHLSSVE